MVSITFPVSSDYGSLLRRNPHLLIRSLTSYSDSSCVHSLDEQYERIRIQRREESKTEDKEWEGAMRIWNSENGNMKQITFTCCSNANGRRFDRFFNQLLINFIHWLCLGTKIIRGKMVKLSSLVQFPSRCLSHSQYWGRPSMVSYAVNIPIMVAVRLDVISWDYEGMT